MELKPRQYQFDAADAAIEAALFEKEKPVIVMPPGTGKSVLPCIIIDEFLSKFPEKNVVLLSHVAEIIEQNHTKLVHFFEGVGIGLYSDQIGIKDVKKITSASIQSCYRKPQIFGDVGLVIIDECHLVGVENKGMYRKFLNHFSDAILIGMTASPWKTGHGAITHGKDAIFSKIAYDLSTYDQYNMLIDEGYLLPLLPFLPKEQMDPEDVKEMAGDYDEKELADKFNRSEFTAPIVRRVVKIAKDKYKKWLVFAIDKEHAIEIEKEFKKWEIKAEAVFTGSARSKDEVLSDLRRGDLQCVINVGMLTTGVDVPDLDLAVFMRPTKSPIFHIQANGRFTRPVYAQGYDLDTKEGRLAAIQASGKTHALILDFSGNTERLGPINGIVVQNKEDKKKGVKNIVSKKCTACGFLNHLRALECINCGEEFLFESKLSTAASQRQIIERKKELPKKNSPKWLNIKRMEYQHHSKNGIPILKVTYVSMLSRFDQYICIEHPKGSQARQIAFLWMRNRVVGEVPKTVKDFFKALHQGRVKKVERVKADISNKFARIIDVELSEPEKIIPKPEKLPDYFDDDIPF